MKNRVWSLLWMLNLLCLIACQSDPSTAAIPKVVEQKAPVAAVNPADSKVNLKPENTSLNETEDLERKRMEEEKADRAKQLENERAEKIKETERKEVKGKENPEKRAAEAKKQKELAAENKGKALQTANNIKEEEAPITAGKLQFLDRSHDFGRIQEGDTIFHEFPFFNTGIIPVVITNVKASCGCTHTKFPEEPIMPGENGVIGVTFDSKGKLGRQKPFISVTTNGFPKIYSLYLEGEVDTERL